MSVVSNSRRFRPEKLRRIFLYRHFILFLQFFSFTYHSFFYLAFYKWKGVKAPKPRGRNFEYLFLKTKLLGNFPVFYSAGSVFIIVPLALLLALALISHSLKLKPFWRLVFFYRLLSVVAAALTFKMILNSEWIT